MKVFLLLLIGATCFVGHKAADTVCSPDWTSFKDEKCFKILDDTSRTFTDAEKACAALEGTPTLTIIHTKEEQDFLSNFLFKTSKKLENFWIGAKFSYGKYHWIDNSELSYVNWDATRGERKKENYCVQMESDEAAVGKWVDELCEKKNLVVCQRMQTWSLERLQKTFLESRKELAEANRKILDQKREFDSLKQNVLPIGFTYTQLPNEKPPNEIWPWMTWKDVSTTYAGVFFRVEGSGSEPFGKTQEENDERVIRIESTLNGGTSLHDTITIDSVTNGQSTKTNQWIWTGDYAKEKNAYIWLRLITTTGEVRPRNMAIRLWKRTG